MNNVFLLVVGGSLGTLSRYYLATWVVQGLGLPFPYGTLSVNLIGCFVIGLLGGWMEKGLALDPNIRLLTMVGFLGAFTTFSSYEYESFQLLKSGLTLPAIAYLTSSVLLGLLAVWLGHQVLRWVV